MPVTASSYAYDGPVQADGSRMVIETHQCANGKPDLQIVYFAPSGFDPSTLLAVHASTLNGQLIAAETASNMATEAAPITLEQTITAFLQAVRTAYKFATKAEACRIAWWLLRRITAGDITDAQCETAFNATVLQWTNAKTNTLTPQSNAWAQFLTAAGI